MKDGSRYAAELYGVKVALSDEKCATLARKGVGTQDVILGVRPEHTQLVFDDAANTIEGVLRVRRIFERS